MKYRISAIIPAYNEENRIEPVIKETRKHVDEVIVIDDCSTDKTGQVAKKAGVEVYKTPENSGPLESFKFGITKSTGNIIVKIDADGEHDPSDIPRIVKPITTGQADIVLGSRNKIARFSERVLSRLTGLKVNVRDTGTGFKAGKKDIFEKMKFIGTCPCGTFVLEAHSLGARIVEVPIKLNDIEKPRKIAWNHVIQFFYVVRLLLKSKL